MNWKFWKKEQETNHAAKSPKQDRPRELPELVGRKLVVGMKIEPDDAWALKYVGRSLDDQPGSNAFRLFSPDKARAAGITVKDWTSLNDHPELILYQGIYNKKAQRVEFEERQPA